MQQQRNYPKMTIKSLGTTHIKKAKDIGLNEWMERQGELWRVNGISLVDAHVRVWTEGWSTPLIFPVDCEVSTHENWSKIC